MLFCLLDFIPNVYFFTENIFIISNKFQLVSVLFFVIFKVSFEFIPKIKGLSKLFNYSIKGVYWFVDNSARPGFYNINNLR